MNAPIDSESLLAQARRCGEAAYEISGLGDSGATVVDEDDFAQSAALYLLEHGGPRPRTDRAVNFALRYATQEPKGVSVVPLDSLRTSADVGPSVEELAEQAMLRYDTQRVLETLSQVRSDIVALLFGLDDEGPNRTKPEVGSMLRIPNGTMSYQRDKAMKQLLHPSRGAVLEPYL